MRDRRCIHMLGAIQMVWGTVIGLSAAYHGFPKLSPSGTTKVIASQSLSSIQISQQDCVSPQFYFHKRVMASLREALLYSSHFLCTMYVLSLTPLPLVIPKIVWGSLFSLPFPVSPFPSYYSSSIRHCFILSFLLYFSSVCYEHTVRIFWLHEGVGTF